jgi:dihydrofolate reductase
MRRNVVLVVAAADNGVIGRDGAMPWHLAADLRRFRRLTTGKPVVMGRKTFESIGKPLPGRHNIVLTRDPGWRVPGTTVVPGLADAIAAAGLETGSDELMVIGGAEIYALARPVATRIELTRIHLSPEGDSFFPDPEPAQWTLKTREDHAAAGGAPAHSFQTYIRR